MSKRIISFGDLLIHFSPEDNNRFMQADRMKMTFTSAEINVCAALSIWGEDVSYITKVPSHALAQKGVGALRSFGINTESIVYGDGRMGLYFLEKGNSLRQSSVIYDRSNTAFSTSAVNDYDLKSAFDGKDIFYITGITPALSEQLTKTVDAVLTQAKNAGLQVFYDVNYRSALSSPEVAGERIMRFADRIDCLIANENHLKMLLGLYSGKSEEEPNERLYELTQKTVKATGIHKIAIPVRRTIDASTTACYGSFFDGNDFAVSNKIQLKALDRVGSGDAFSAGIIYSVIHSFSVQNTIDYATASNAFKSTINDDISFSTPEEIMGIMKKNSLDVKR